ncbi:MAG: radical SAM/SPASM domain-containing protein [Nanoarchaeota archaeon]
MYKAEFQLTTDCNMNCVFCFNKGQDSRELEKSVVFEQINDGIQRGLEYVWLTGGEALLDFEKAREIILYCKKLGVKTGLSTNGMLLPKYISKLEKAGLDSVRVSLDSVSKKNFEEQRGGCFETVLQGIRLAGISNMQTIIRVTVSVHNVDEVPEIIGLSGSLGADSVEVKPVLPVGKADFAIMPTPQKFYEVFQRATNGQYNIPVTCVCNFLPECKDYYVKPNVECQCSHSAIYIAASGEIMPCSYFPSENRFNAYSDFISTAWDSDFFERVVNTKPEKCSLCSRWESCRNGCPAVLHHYGCLGEEFFEFVRGISNGMFE